MRAWGACRTTPSIKLTLFFQPYPFLCRANFTYEGVFLLGTSIALPHQHPYPVSTF